MAKREIIHEDDPRWNYRTMGNKIGRPSKGAPLEDWSTGKRRVVPDDYATKLYALKQRKRKKPKKSQAKIDEEWAAARYAAGR